MTPAKKPTRGRPAGSGENDAVVRLRLPGMMKSTWVKAAQKDGMNLSEWIKAKCNN